MYVKLAFSVAAHLDSEIMIMDEVLAVGDMAFQKKCLDKMREAAQKDGRTVLYVSHNMNTIRQLCDRCVVLNKGKVVFQGDVEDAIDVYMQSNKSESPIMTFETYERPRWITSMQMKLLQADFVGKDDVLFADDEPILLHLRWENLCDLQDVGLRIEVWSMDDVTRCSYMLPDFYSGPRGKKEDITLKLDTTGLVEENYRMLFTFFIRDSSGNSVEIDAVFGLCFEKITKKSDKILWKPRNWGYIQMPEPTIL